MGRSRSGAPEKVRFVEGLRGIAALYVVLGHLASMSDPSGLAGKASAAPTWFQRLIAPLAFGHLAVAGFIVISGYCLQLSLFAGGDGRIKSGWAFYARRARRILPAYYACLAASIAVAFLVTSRIHGMPFAMYVPVTRANVWAHILLVHNLSTDWMYKLNGVLWSIATEAQLYLLFPLLVASLFRIGRLGTVFFASLAAVLVLALAPNALKLYPWYLPLFACGMASAHFAYRPHRSVGLRAGVAKMLALAAAGTCVYGLERGWYLPTTDAWLGISVAALCYYGTVARPTPLVRFLSCRPVFVLGGFSYSLYLMHHPIQQVLYWVRPVWVRGEVATFWYLLASLPVILLVAWLFSLVFERPFLSKKHSARPKKAFVPTSLPLITASGRPGRSERDRTERRPPNRSAVQATIL